MFYCVVINYRLFFKTFWKYLFIKCKGQICVVALQRQLLKRRRFSLGMSTNHRLSITVHYCTLLCVNWLERGVYEISVRSMNIDDQPATDRPISGPIHRFCKKIQMAITLQRVKRFPSCLVLGWGFRGRRIERRHFRFDKIQDGGRRPSWKTSNGHISATHYLLYCIYSYTNHTLPSVSNL